MSTGCRACDIVHGRAFLDGVLQNANTRTILDRFAPFGLNAVMEGRVIPNTVLPVKQIYEAKVARWQKIWPDLIISPWPDEDGLVQGS